MGDELDTTNYAHVIFTSVKNGTTNNYAVLLVRIRPTIEQTAETMILATGFVMQSADGEFRGHAPSWANVEQMMKDPQMAYNWEKFETIILNELRDATIDELYFFPSAMKEAARKPIRELIGASRIAVKAMCVYLTTVIEAQAMLRGASREECNVDQIKWLEPVSNLIDIYDAVWRENPGYMRIWKNFYGSLHIPKVGLKIEPLTINEAANMENVRYRAWREIYANKATKRSAFLVGMTPRYTPWHVFHGACTEAFQNPRLRAKYYRGQLAESAMEHLIEAARIMSEGSVPVPKAGMPRTADMEAGAFADDIRRSAEEVLNNVRMSNVAICVLSTIMGAPLSRLSSLCNIDPDRRRFVDSPEEQHMTSFAALLMFAFCALHQVAGVIHADAHTSNILIRRTSGRSEIAIALMGNLYLIKTPNFNPEIIDFSRVIIPMEKLGSPAEFAGLLAAFVNRACPEVYGTHTKLINELINEDPGSAFRIFAVLDIMQFLDMMTALYSERKLPAAASFFLDAKSRITSAITSQLLNWREKRLAAEWTDNIVIPHIFARFIVSKAIEVPAGALRVDVLQSGR